MEIARGRFDCDMHVWLLNKVLFAEDKTLKWMLTSHGQYLLWNLVPVTELTVLVMVIRKIRAFPGFTSRKFTGLWAES